jgi:hypothetical protein
MRSLRNRPTRPRLVKAIAGPLGYSCVCFIGLAVLICRGRAARAPQTLEDVARIAARLGLQCRGDRADGEAVLQVVISREPVSFAETNRLRWDNFGHPVWRGCVVARLLKSRYSRSLPEPEPNMVWGGVLLVGDTELIATLWEATH